MNAETTTSRYLGAAFLGVVLTSAVSGAATATATGSGAIADVLTKTASSTGLLHFATLAGMINAVGILVLAALLYAVLNGQGKIMAIIASLCWAGESFCYATDQIALVALGHVASDFQASGGVSGPDATLYQSLGEYLFTDFHQTSGTILMFFYCAGGLLFYALFFTSRCIPRWISTFGLIAVAIGIAGASAGLLGLEVGLLPYISILPFELVIGGYLLVRGTQVAASSQRPPGREVR